MTAPIKTCDYCGATGAMPTFMDGETICYTCLQVLPKTLPGARQELIRVRAELAIAQPKPSVPDGWKLVPIEPTPEMLRALIDGANQYDSWNEGYRDMLAAAPEAKP